jgi:hypothetical protein
MSEYNLKSNLNKLKDKPFNFALIEGKQAQMLLVTPRRAPARLVDETKMECGNGKQVAKGICMREDGQIMFATRLKPSPAWKSTIKKIFVAQKCTSFGPIDIRQLKETELEEAIAEEEGTPAAVSPESAAIPPAPPLPPSPTPKPQATSAARPGSASVVDLGKAQLERFTAVTRKVLGAPVTDPALKKQLAILFGQAKQLAAAKKFDELKVCLDQIESQSTASVGGAPPAGKVQFEKIHLDWNAKKQAIGGRLAALHQAILSEFNDSDGNTAAQKLDRVLARFNEGLGDTLDEMRNATTPQARSQLAAKSSAIADRYLSYLESDPLVAHLEGNPFNINLQIKETLSAPLTQLKQQLQQLNP